jgi:ribonuclease P protein component
MDQRFLREHRLRRKTDFDRIYGRRASVSDGTLLIFGDENGLNHPRLGLSVSRKVGSAVRRNRWKRLLREAFRLSRERLPVGIDLIVIPRNANPPHLEEIQHSLIALAGRLKRKLGRAGSVPSARPKT